MVKRMSIGRMGKKIKVGTKVIDLTFPKKTIGTITLKKKYKGKNVYYVDTRFGVGPRYRKQFKTINKSKVK